MAGDRDSSTIITTVTITAAALVATYLLYRAIRKPSRKLIGTVKELYVYPVKSCAGIKLDGANCCIDGFKWDRRWMVIDESDFLSLRTNPKLALVKTAIEDNQLKLTAPDMPPISVPTDLKTTETAEMNLFDTKVAGLDCGKEVGEWFSKFLNKPNCRLLFKADDSPNRYVKDDPVWGLSVPDNDQSGYTNLTAYHLTFTASLDVLNSKTSHPVSMQNFRANIIIQSEEAYVEDRCTYYYIDNVVLRKVKNCERCLLTTVDPDTGIRDKRQEPISVLRKDRLSKDPRHKKRPLFGISTSIDQLGPVAIGSSVFAT